MIFTVGHSTYDRETFARMVRGIDVVIDVRSHPVSNHVPDYHKHNAEVWFPAEAQVGYEWWPELGGWDVRHAQDPELVARMAGQGVDLNAYSRGVFPKQRIGVDRRAKPEPGTAWTNQGLWDYQWFTTLPEFADGIKRLVAAGREHNVAIMCCEWAWWKCHRSMVADRLAWAGTEIKHLAKPSVRDVRSRASAHPGADRINRYHPLVIEAWRDQS